MAKDSGQSGKADGEPRRPARVGSKGKGRAASAGRRQQAEKQVRGIGGVSGREGRVKSDPDRAERVIRFIECLIVPSGEGQGRAFRLREWQKRFIRDIYSPHIVRNGAWRRRVRRAVLSIARKNGKTALIAALVLVHLVGPESVQNGEIYSAANDREQAAQVFKVVAQMVRADAELADVLKVVDSTKTVACFANGSFYKAMSAEAGTKHGLNPTVVIYDELAQAKNRELYDVLDTSMGAREEPIFVTISTQSNDPQHILSQLIDDGLRANDPTIVVHLYAVPDDVPDIYDESCWALANPALGDFRSLEEMRAMAARAQRLPSFEAPFCNLYLNQRVDAQSPLIPRSEWMACQVENTLELGEEIYLGLDLSGTTDLCALVAVSAKNGDRTKAWFWKPKELLQLHSDRDRAPYVDWERAGHLIATPGRSVDYGFVAQHLAEVCSDYKVLGLAFDRWKIKFLLKELGTIGLDHYHDGKDKPRADALRLVDWGQGFKDMGPAIDALEISVLERRFAHDGNPVQTFCFSNAVTVADPAGNRKMDKSKIRFRIDGAVAAAMAVGLKGADAQEPVGKSFWESAD